MSNPSFEPGRGAAAGRALLLVIALFFVAGLAWLWLARDRREVERASAPSAPEARAEVGRSPELVPARAQRSEGAPSRASDELEPFASARTNAPPDGERRGSLRGHVEVAGEGDFPREWKLVVRPSTTLPEREHAVERTLELTDGQSDFALADLPLGGYDVVAEAEGFNGQVLPVLLEPGAEHPFVNLHIVPAGTLEGVVLDSHGVAAEGIVVTLLAVEESHAREARTDARGAYRFEKLPDGAYELLLGTATAPLVPERHAVRFLAPHLTFPDLTLPPLGEIDVRVVDSFARPLEGVEVRGSGTNGGAFEGKTDFDGRLVAKHLPPGHFRMRLKHPAFEAQYERRIAVDVVADQIADAPVRLGP